MLTVHEAAKRLNRSTEQVRRYLREGKLKGQRIGNQWFVDEKDLGNATSAAKHRPLIPLEVQERARQSREAIFKRTGILFDVVADLHADREAR
ncbi:MAG TPA: helix-turn-helix domain-containing protein [Dehalococcoidia bacterium]|nr:helix-turn-helix domain-containing protein [Dehalococcoidia bacterium]